MLMTVVRFNMGEAGLSWAGDTVFGCIWGFSGSKPGGLTCTLSLPFRMRAGPRGVSATAGIAISFGLALTGVRRVFRGTVVVYMLLSRIRA